METMDDIEIRNTPPSIEFGDLQIGYRVYDFDDESFGEIVDKKDDDPDWWMIEVKWEREDPSIDDRSYVLPGKHIGIVITPDHPFYTTISDALGDKLDKMQEQYGDDLTLLALASW